MLFLLRTDEELGIKRESTNNTEEKAPEVSNPDNVGTLDDASPTGKKKKKKSKGKDNHNTNRIFIKDINKACDDYMFNSDKKIYENTEKILYINKNSELILEPEAKSMREIFRRNLHTNLESVFDGIQNGSINVNAPLDTSAFSYDCAKLSMFTPGMQYKDTSKSAQQQKEAEAATAAMGDGALDPLMSQMPMENGMPYDDGVFYQQQKPEFNEPPMKKSNRGRKKKKFSEYY